MAVGALVPPPAFVLPQATIEPSFLSPAKAARLAEILVKVENAGEGAPLPPVSELPHAEMDPFKLVPVNLSAAKAPALENTVVNPVSVGAPVPPKVESPHVVIDPSAFIAANAPLLENTWVYPVAVGAPVPPFNGSPQEEMDPSEFSAANA